MLDSIVPRFQSQAMERTFYENPLTNPFHTVESYQNTSSSNCSQHSTLQLLAFCLSLLLIAKPL